MFTHFFLTTVAVLSNVVPHELGVAAQSGPPAVGKPDITAGLVRSIFEGAWIEDLAVRELHRAGSRAFRAYETILADPTSKPEVVCGVLEMLNGLTLDRGQFLQYARQRLLDRDPAVRFCAVKLLGSIGTVQDTSALAAFLSDERKGTVRSAALSLAKIGVERDILALDVWLVAGRYRDDADLRKQVTQCRDDLKQRLDKQKSDPKK